jgi:ABC-type tungstate transport system permease subunit
MKTPPKGRKHGILVQSRNLKPTMPYIAVYKQLAFERDSYLKSFMRFIMRPSTMIHGLMFSASVHAVKPAAVYNGGFNTTNNIALRIGNGGAGQSGLIEGNTIHPSGPPTKLIPPSNTLPSTALANAFIKGSVKNGSDPFEIAWYKSDTTQSINYLKDDTVDIGITYAPAAEQIAIKNGIAKSPAWYTFRDHFLLVGPPSNPANLSETQDIQTQFSNLYTTAETGNTDPPVRFLSRYDKSATNIKESQLWIEIGQVPWATAYSTWYHQYIAFPIQALTAAILLDEYTITDRGTYLSIPTELQSKTVIYKAASDDAEDPLLNPAHILIGVGAMNEEMADRFARWAISDEGREVITGFKKNGQQLYTAAPANKTAQFRGVE